MKIDSARVDDFGRGLDIGWFVTVHLGQGFTPTTTRLPVVASTLRFDPDTGWERTIDLGTEKLSGPAAIYAAVARSRARARQAESEIR